ncbi:unnamed protein product [Candida verbasci]|uniref:Nucleolar pre-ribosomal-associated protein 1 C-terminal domain-containing protein n=1 Tax=Candida verbasci TaxID=1227364 RepID=A0A9W4TTL3_9ASCO|nr:unnamed protein product [Candida verbasci]
MSETKKRKIYSSQSVNIDYSLIEQLNNLQTSKNLVSDLNNFINLGQLNKILPVWSYYSSTNNHGNFIDLINKIVFITDNLNEVQNANLVTEFFKNILQNHLKLIYRSLTNLRNSITIPTLKILTNILKFDSSLSNEFLNSNFDFNLPVIPKLLTPNKFEIENNVEIAEGSIRFWFLKFFITLCYKLNFFNRFDLLNNYPKIMKTVWKFINSDSIETIEFLVSFFDKKVLDERNFKKAQKCKILNENFMFKIQPLILKIKESFFYDFIIKLTTDLKNGICFPNDKSLWQIDNSIGVTIDVNNKHFKIANKLIYTLLTSLKPNESNKIINLLTKICEANQEIIPAYLNYIVQSGGGYHDPNLTTWWISYTLLYSNLLQIEPPKSIQIQGSKFDYKLISENIAFAPLSKSVLTAGLTEKQPNLINQLTLQLILYTLIRLEKFITALQSRQELIDLVFAQLPDINQICQCYQLPNISNLSKITILKIISRYEEFIISNNNNNLINKIASNGILSITENLDNNLTKLDLIYLNLYLQIQKNQENFKWWNKIKTTNSNYSFFTILIKLATKNSDKNFNLKIYNLLNKLCAGKMLFNEGLLITPIMSLIYSQPQNEKIWNLLDETIARCIRAPYKYLDISHSLYHDTSTFIICLIEQFKFIKAEKFEDEWLISFLKYCILFDGDQISIIKLAEESKLDTKELNFDITKKIDQKDSSIMEIVYSYSTEDIIKNPNLLEKKIISSKLDYLSILCLIDLMGKKTKNPTKLLQSLFEKLYNYLMSSSDENSVNYFSSEKVWKGLIESSTALEFYNEILTNLPNINTDSLAHYVVTNYTKNFESILWILTEDQLNNLLTIDDFIPVVSQCIVKDISVDKLTFYKLYNTKVDERNHLLVKLIDRNLVQLENTEVVQFVDDLISNHENYFLIPYIINKFDFIVPDLLSKDIQDDYLNTLIVFSMIKKDVEVPEEYLSKVIQIIINKLNANALGDIKWNQILTIISKTNTISTEICSLILSKIHFKHSLIPEFIKFISTFETTPELSKWLHQSMLYITKKIVESETLSSNFYQFLNAIGDYLLSKKNIWDIVPSSILNTQIEGLLSSKHLQSSSSILKYLVKLILVSPKSKIEYLKLFQILINLPNNKLEKFPTNENEEIRYYIAVLLYLLFNFDHSKLSNFSTMMILIEKFYLATNRFEDLIIKTILIKIESKTAVSWVSKISNWEFIDEINEIESDLVGRDRLIKKTSDGNFTIFLNKNMCLNTLNSIQYEVPELKKDKKAFWNRLKEMNELNELLNVHKLSYDLEFLLMIILNNEELLQYSNNEEVVKYYFNIKNLIDNGFLQVIVSNLTNSKYKLIIKIILNKLLNSIDDNLSFKDKQLYKVLISTILFNIDKNIPYLIFYFYGQLIPILSNPGHFLYEKSYRYILSHPIISTWELPLYKSIIQPEDKDNEHYYRELKWFIETITNGIKTVEDLNILRKEVIEFILNLFNSYYLNPKLKCSIFKLIYQIQSIDQGSDMLITRFGILSNLDLIINGLNDDGTIDKQIKLNILELLNRFKLSIGESKRVNDWTRFNLNNTLIALHDKIT